MSKRKGNVLLVGLMCLMFAVWAGSRYWNLHQTAAPPEQHGCEWKSTNWIISEQSFICGGVVSGQVWKGESTWQTMHARNSYETKEMAMQAEFEAIKREK